MNKNRVEMKKTFLSLVFLLGLSYAWAACDDDDNRYKPSEEIITSFNSQFPGVKNVEWEKKNVYQVADFMQDGVEKEAWFDSAGNLLLTEEDLPYSLLPATIREWIASSEYAAWQIDDVDKVIRNGQATVYVVELESGKSEVYIYFTETGEWIKTQQNASDSSDKYLPTTMPDAIQNYLTENYPQAVVLDFEKEKVGYELDILDAGVKKELAFDMQMQWVSTHYDVSPLSLPQTVKDALAQSQWADWRIDDAEYWQETGKKDYYELELEQGSTERIVRIDIDGVILNTL